MCINVSSYVPQLLIWLFKNWILNRRGRKMYNEVLGLSTVCGYCMIKRKPVWDLVNISASLFNYVFFCGKLNYAILATGDHLSSLYVLKRVILLQ